MKTETILTITAIVFFAIAIIFFAKIVFGYAQAEEYKFNMTRYLENEGRVVAICIETTIQLPFCDTRYGGIETTYGEKIN